MNTDLQKKEVRLGRRWRSWISFFRAVFAPALNFKCDDYTLDTPFIVVSNHVTNWDPFFVGLNFPRNNIHFVAGEAIFKHGLLSKGMQFFVDPIPRRKAANAADTVMRCMRTLRAGGNIGLFAEGETTWNGVTNRIVPSTGKLVRSSGAALVTYRIEGGYFKLPRWSKKMRRIPVHAHVVGIYTPEQLKAMKPLEINALIERDIYENAWERQRQERVVIPGDDRAVGIEKALFLCPKCGGTDTLHGEGNRVRCSCGLDIEYTNLGFFDPPEPFETLLDWDRWQMEQLRERKTEPGQPMFSAPSMTLTRYDDGGKSGRVLGTGTLVQYPEAIELAGTRFPLREISDMAMFKANRLLLSIGTDYYEIRSNRDCNMRKYLAVWKNERSSASGLMRNEECGI